VRKMPFWRHFIRKLIILPRQARDKHREKLREKGAIFAGGSTSIPLLLRMARPL
jgi:hypothetical protein